MQHRYDYHDDSYQVRLDKQPDGSYLARIGDDSYTVHATPLTHGTWLLDHDGKRYTVHVAKAGDERYVQLAGERYTLQKSDKRRKTSRGSQHAGDLSSEMPGQVLEVRVTEGEDVTSGQVLLVLEAMKMEIRITAPHDGTVTRLTVAQGDVVDRGQVLAEVVPMTQEDDA